MELKLEISELPMCVFAILVNIALLEDRLAETGEERLAIRSSVLSPRMRSLN